MPILTVVFPAVLNHFRGFLETMESLPQVESIASSRDVSTKDVLQILKRFLKVQKAFFKKHENDTMIIDEEGGEAEYFDDRAENKLGFDEFNQRIDGIIESLDDNYFQVKIKADSEENSNEASTVGEVTMSSKDESRIKESKEDKKERKRAMKKEAKEAKRAMKKAAKEVKKAAKEKQKLMKKERKEKRKREKAEGSSKKKLKSEE